jgi:hypothetical protein
MRMTLHVLLSLSFFFTTCVHAEHAETAEARRFQVLRPDGTPAGDAKVTLLQRKTEKTELSKRAVRTDKAGWFETDDDFESDDFTLNAVAIVVEARGAALGIWNLIPADQATLQLIEEFQVQGVIHDPAGEPLANAEVRVIDFGTFTYLPFDQAILTAMDGVRCSTNAQGQFQLRGMTYNGYEFAAGARVLATAELNGRLHTAQWNSQYAGNSTKLEKHGEADLEVLPIVLAPVSRIRGRIIRVLDHQPLAGAELHFHPATPSNASTAETDAQGRFEIELATFEIRRFSIHHPDLASRISIREESLIEDAHVDIDDWEIIVWPAVMVQGTAVDEIALKPPTMPLRLEYERETQLRQGWISTEQRFFAIPESSDGRFELALPSGEIAARVSAERHGSWPSPYDYELKIKVNPDNPDLGQLRLPRRKGLFVQMRSTNDIELDRAVLDSLIVTVRIAGDNSFGYADRSTLWFYPVIAWGQKVSVEIEQQGNDGRRKKLLPEKIFDTAEHLWPQVIEIEPEAIPPQK